MNLIGLSRSGEFGKVFSQQSLIDFEVELARIAVLYEDLRLEVSSAFSPTYPDIHGLPENTGYRRLYFGRKAIGTACEFAESLRMIDRSSRFKALEQAAIEARDPYYQEQWLAAKLFFEQNRKLIEDIRNDIGGHFGTRAARYAVTEVNPRFLTEVTIRLNDKSGVRLGIPFAAEIASTSLLKHLTGDTTDEKLKAFMELVDQCVRLAVLAVHFLVANGLFPLLTDETPLSEI